MLRMFIRSAYVSCCETVSGKEREGRRAGTDDVLQTTDLFLLSPGGPRPARPPGSDLAVLSAPDALHDFAEEGDTAAICDDGFVGVFVGRVELNSFAGEFESTGKSTPGGRRTIGGAPGLRAEEAIGRLWRELRRLRRLGGEDAG
jgi:hypothetical protein